MMCTFRYAKHKLKLLCYNLTVATIAEAHTAWLDAVMPNALKEFSFSRASYLDSFGAPQNFVDAKKDSVVIRRPHGMCPSQADHSLHCALDTCLLSEYWPAECCSQLACRNGGRSDYVGVCQCRCTPPFAGRLCETIQTQVCCAVRPCALDVQLA
jgi:hypothetical protein